MKSISITTRPRSNSNASARLDGISVALFLTGPRIGPVGFNLILSAFGIVGHRHRLPLCIRASRRPLSAWVSCFARANPQFPSTLAGSFQDSTLLDGDGGFGHELTEPSRKTNSHSTPVHLDQHQPLWAGTNESNSPVHIPTHERVRSGMCLHSLADCQVVCGVVGVGVMGCRRG